MCAKPVLARFFFVEGEIKQQSVVGVIRDNLQQQQLLHNVRKYKDRLYIKL